MLQGLKGKTVRNAQDKVGWGALALLGGGTMIAAAALALRSAPAGGWLALDRAWQGWAMGLALMASLRTGRPMGISDWGLAALAGAALTLGDPLSRWLHPLLLKMSLYPPFWGRGNDPQQSAQYARLLVWSMLLAAGWWRIARGRRELARLFAMLAASSTLLTSMIFHAAVVKGAQQEQAKLFEQARMMIQEPSGERFEGFCQASKARCARGESQIKARMEEWDRGARERAEQSLRQTARHGPGSVAVWRQTQPTEEFNRLPTAIIAVGISQGREMRVWKDETLMKAQLELGQEQFAWLALWAHGVWLWGGLGLCAWHQSRLKRRRSMEGETRRPSDNMES